MGQVIVAFERQSNAGKIREILESTGEFTCLTCRDGGQIRRAVHKLRINLVVCGFKLLDESCEALYGDLPQRCAMLMIAPQAQLDLCSAAGIFKLPSPIRRTQLLGMAAKLEQLTAGRDASAQRSEEDWALVERAKAALMSRHGMSEGQAHRFLQKESMNRGARLIDTAQRVLDEN